MLRIDSDAIQRFGDSCRDDLSSTKGFGFSFGLLVIAVSAMVGAAPLSTVSGLFALLLGIGVPVLCVIGWLFVYHHTDAARIYGGGYYESSTIQSRATEMWYKLNEENREITRHLVLKIYDLYPQKAANGDRLYEGACQTLENTVRQVLDEQIASEKALAEAETKLQLAGRTSIDNDVRSVLDYVEAMKHTRQEFTAKALKIGQ